MKIGLDIHGCIDAYPDLFRVLAKALINDGHEIHVITGPSKKRALEDLEKCGFKEGEHFTHFCSIIDYRASQGVEVKWDERGNGWLRSDIWDSAKAEYCEEVGIDFHIDDSEVYGKFFKNTVYLRKER